MVADGPSRCDVRLRVEQWLDRSRIDHRCLGLNWLFVAPRLRTYTEIANNAITIPDYLENRFKDHTRLLRIVSALVIFIFFTFYTSSGMVAGGELFKSAFGMDYLWGIWLTAGVVILDPYLAVSRCQLDRLCPGNHHVSRLGPGPDRSTHPNRWNECHLQRNSLHRSRLDGCFQRYERNRHLSLLAWGLGYFGQPHIIVRFMAITSVKEMSKARRIGMGWMIFSVGGAMFTGLIGIAYFHQEHITLEHAETVFIMLAKILFHPLITGFLLAAIMAAIMSTISSQLLVTASALTQDSTVPFFAAPPRTES